jgi:hypothetical protein
MLGVESMEREYSEFYNKGNDCDNCKNQYLTGLDGDAYGCKCKDDNKDCKYEENKEKEC